MRRKELVFDQLRLDETGRTQFRAIVESVYYACGGWSMKQVGSEWLIWDLRFSSVHPAVLEAGYHLDGLSLDGRGNARIEEVVR